MHIPKDYKVSIEEICFDGLFKPKFFLAVSVESKESGICMTQYIIGHPLFLRLRLFLGLSRCVRMLKKYKKFSS